MTPTPTRVPTRQQTCASVTATCRRRSECWTPDRVIVLMASLHHAARGARRSGTRPARDGLLPHRAQVPGLSCGRLVCVAPGDVDHATTCRERWWADVRG